MADRTKPDPPRPVPGERRTARAQLPTSNPGQREEWARFIEQLGASFRELYSREQQYLKSNPDDKQSRASAEYYRHGVGVVEWIAWRIRAGKLRPLSSD